MVWSETGVCEDAELHLGPGGTLPEGPVILDMTNIDTGVTVEVEGVVVEPA